MLSKLKSKVKYRDIVFKSLGLIVVDSRIGIGVIFEYKEYWVFWFILVGIKY